LVTVIDPAGTPVPFYNRSGVTIVEVSGTTGSPPAPIPAFSGWTVAITTRGAGGGGWDAYELPSGAEVGDVVEVHSADGNLQDLYAPPGETIRGTSSIALAPMGGSGIFRKYSPTQWA
jgi:hypothetical protein